MQSEGPIIGVDLGGTSIRAAVVRDGEIVAAKDKKTQADQGAEIVIERVERAVRDALERAGVKARECLAVGVGAPGAVDARSGLVRRAPNLDWTDVALGDRLGKRLKLPVVVGNDVEFGLLGEHVYGAGRGHLHVAAVFVGTGIGGALIVNGAPHLGARGAAGEIGHMVVSPGGRVCGCGRKGCIEAYASKTAMEAMIRERVGEGQESIVPALMEKKGRRVLSSSIIEAALEQGDAVMRAVVDDAEYHLGLLTANLVNAFDPEVVVFGGGITARLGEPFLDAISTTARRHYLRQDGAETIRIVPALLGDDAATLGATVAVLRHR